MCCSYCAIPYSAAEALTSPSCCASTNRPCTAPYFWPSGTLSRCRAAGPRKLVVIFRTGIAVKFWHSTQLSAWSRTHSIESSTSTIELSFQHLSCSRGSCPVVANSQFSAADTPAPPYLPVPASFFWWPRPAVLSLFFALSSISLLTPIFASASLFYSAQLLSTEPLALLITFYARCLPEVCSLDFPWINLWYWCW